MTEALAPKGADRLDNTKFFPVTWTGTSPGYWDYYIRMLMAQYMGEDEYQDFMDFIPAGGESAQISSGYTVYENRGVYEALKVAEKLQNSDFAVPGTASMNHISAQARLFEGSSLFMVSGDWIYKEMEKSYKNYLDDVIAVKNPVVSALGVKLGLCGTTHEEPKFNAESVTKEYSCANCETKLRAVVKAVDEGKTDAEIATEVGVTETQVATVRERRGYYCAANGMAALMPSYSDAKTVAKTFLRFLCSDDGIDIYFKNTYSNFMVNRITPPAAGELDAKGQAIYEKMYSANATRIFEKSNCAIRVANGTSIFPAEGTTKAAYSGISYSHIDTANPRWTAEKMYLENVRIAKGNWRAWLQTAGLI
jgi:ABC-type glycerol-3-phosphate transport system substrate-binding protein